MHNSEKLPPEGCQLTAYRLHEHDTFLKIVPAPADRFWMDFTTHGWANRCLPLRIANQAGWHILNNSKFEVEWNGKPDVDAVTIHFLDGRPSRFVKSNFGFGILTWYLPYLFRTSPGYNLLVRGPANLPKDGISAIEGLVETDWVEGTFSVNWKITRPFMKIRFEIDDTPSACWCRSAAWNWRPPSRRSATWSRIPNCCMDTRNGFPAGAHLWLR